MQIISDALLALLACVGLWTLGRMALDFLFEDGGPEVAMWTVVRAWGDGSGLEQAVHKLPRQERGVVLVDCGLDERGRALALRLAKAQPQVSFCRWERLGSWMKEAEVWTSRWSTTK